MTYEDREREEEEGQRERERKKKHLVGRKDFRAQRLENSIRDLRVECSPLLTELTDLHEDVDEDAEVAVGVQVGVLRLQVVLQQDDVLVPQRVDQLPVLHGGLARVEEHQAVQ